MNTKPFLVSLTSNCEGLKENYLDSLDKLEGSVEPIMVAFHPYPPAEMGKLQFFMMDKPYPGNMDRFIFFPKGFKDDDMIIFTDASDVIFQCPIPKLGNEIYVAEEQATFSKDSWFAPYFDKYNFHELDDLPIYNMGTWAMPYSKVKEMINFIFDNQYRFPHWACADQPLYNLWLRKQNFIIKPSLFGCLYDGYAKGTVIKKHNRFEDAQGQVISIVHANGSLKHLLKF